MPLKVLVISNYRSTHTMRPEAEMFIALKKRGVEVDIMTYGDATYTDKFREAGIRVIDFHPLRKFDKAESQRIRNELIDGGHHILHLFNSKAIVNGLRAAKCLPVKVVLYRGYTGNIHWWDPTAYLKFLHPRVDMIHCLAQSVEDHFHKQLFFVESKTRVINKGHQTGWYDAVETSDLREFVINNTDIVISCVANTRPMKGIPYLIKAIALVDCSLPIQFLLIGKDLDPPYVKKLLKSNPNRDKIHFTGFRSDALSLVKASDIFVLPSIKGEATTKAVIEAMSMEVCPVITDIPGNRELVVHQECGLVVPRKNPKALAEAFRTLCKDEEKRKKFGINARLHIEKRFNLNDTVERMIAVYRDIYHN